ncbi:hypothetical protein P4O66_023108 [Electrophorus voltai]|uniref:Uncharacterized protein n=1 Tax=Electrophorus voltai TaxID=2609070 RepID=A0AAD8YRI0_9TELE|nr:hypothetical protein P4O66_023108 [Electrophorus voltai]
MMMQEVSRCGSRPAAGKRAALVEVKRLLAAELKTENKLTAAKIRNLALQMRFQSHLKETINFVELEIQAKLANLAKIKAMIGNKRKALAGVMITKDKLRADNLHLYQRCQPAEKQEAAPGF